MNFMEINYIEDIYCVEGAELSELPDDVIKYMIENNMALDAEMLIM